MNGYDLSRQWFDFAFENQDKVMPKHGALYFWLIELNNRLGWVENFKVPLDTASAAIGMSRIQTTRDTLNELVEWGFVRLIIKSPNHHVANVISLSKCLVDSRNYLDASIQSNEKRSTNRLSNVQLSDQEAFNYPVDNCSTTAPIIKPVNKETNKQINISFDDFWNAYGKKEGAKKCRTKWESLTDAQRAKAMEDIPKYRESLNKPEYQKMPMTYLNGEHWNDERFQAVERDNGGRPQYDPTQHPNSPHNARSKRVFL